MSLALVAYGSSDESGESDGEDNTTQQAEVPQAAVNGEQPSDTSSNETAAATATTSSAHDQANDSSLDGKLRDLPEPKIQSTSVLEENDVLEDEVKPKASQLADAPKPPSKKTRKPVQITVPALPDPEERKETEPVKRNPNIGPATDVDENEETEPVKKKPKLGPATGKSGLTSLLPAPVHAAKKEAGRILLPYSLTRKVNPNPTPPAPSVKKPPAVTESQKAKSLTTSLADYGSDSDENDGNNDEPVNFFSLGSSQEKDTAVKTQENVVNSFNVDSVEQTVSLPPTVTRTSLNLPAPVQDSLEVQKTGTPESDSSVVKDVDNEMSDLNEVEENETSSASHLYGPTVDPDAPLSFKGGISRSYPTHSSHTAASNMMYSVEYAGSHSYPEADDEQALQQDEQFLRLQGKNRRGKEEINIVDVNADDFTSPAEISKYISEEQPHQSHRKKDGNNPTHQQKRKHQIQYLAFEAKERELELKNQWSNNKMTRKQTQAKYGF